MSRISLRVRLAMASAVGVFVVSALAGFVQFRLSTDNQYDRVDEQLDQVLDLAPYMAVLSKLRTITGTKPFDAQRLLRAIAEGKDVVMRYYDRTGKPLADEAALFNSPIPIDSEVAEAVSEDLIDFDIFYTARVYGTRMRVRARTFPGGFALIAARSIEDIIRAQREFARFLFVEVALATLLAGLLGYLVARQAMLPVRRLAATAQQVADTADLARRVESSRADRDLTNLTATFNHMLDQIEAAYRRIAAALESEKRFVADASHELRTPLTTIQGNIDYLARTGADAAAVSDLRVATGRLVEMVAKLTQLAREEAGAQDSPQLLDFDELVLDVSGEPAYSGLDLDVDVDRDLWVQGSEASIASVVRNLIDNAAKYGRGHVDVEARRDGDWVRLDVRDDGPGVAVADVEHVFERFWRAPDVQGKMGSGLGLSIVRSAVEAQGGSVRALPGPGGHFQAKWPARDLPQLDDVAPDQAEEEVARRVPSRHAGGTASHPEGKSV